MANELVEEPQTGFIDNAVRRQHDRIV
jgi:hypothetical protein